MSCSKLYERNVKDDIITGIITILFWVLVAVLFSGCATVSYYYPLNIKKTDSFIKEYEDTKFHRPWLKETTDKSEYLKNGEIKYKGRFLFGYTGSNMLREIVEIEKELRKIK